MKRIVGIGVLLWAGGVCAQSLDAGVEPPSAGSAGHLAVLVPQIVLEGKTEGSAELRASLGLLYGVSKFDDIGLRLNVRTATSDGLVTLFGASAESGPESALPFEMGATVSWVRGSAPRGQPPDRTPTLRKAYSECVPDCRDPVPSDSKAFCEKRKQSIATDEAYWRAPIVISMQPADFCAIERPKVEEAARLASEADFLAFKSDALRRCLEPCTPASPDAFCRQPRFASRPLEAGDGSLSRYDPEKSFCPAGAKVIEDLGREEREQTSRYPRAILNAGFRAGASEHKFLEASADDAMVFTPTKKTLGSVAFGASGVWLLGSGGITPTLEARVGFARSFQDSSTTVKYCFPSGSVTPAEGEAAVSAEQCSERLQGRPEVANKLDAAFFIGLIDEPVDRYRLSAGLSFSTPIEHPDRYKLTLSLPAWIKIVGDEGKYSGLIRIGPAVSWTRTVAGEVVTTFSLELALLGQRYFFTEDFDRL